jgi:2-oxoglutarate dehydrogenase E2 component (dihydrolipoamide succinyltransferase)
MDIRIPEVGESVSEVLLTKWFKQDGDMVKKDDSLFQMETIKITLDINADADGFLSIKLPEGSLTRVGNVVGTIDEQAVAARSSSDV